MVVMVVVLGLRYSSVIATVMADVGLLDGVRTTIDKNKVIVAFYNDDIASYQQWLARQPKRESE